MAWNGKTNTLYESETYTDAKELGDRLSGSVFRFCEFENMNPEGTLVEAEFISCFFTNVDWYWGLFISSLFVDTRFEDCVFRGASFTDCRFLNCEFVNCMFVKNNLNTECSFEESKWFECKAMGCSGLPNVEAIRSMENDAATAYIRRMIEEFKIPGSDTMSHCLLVAPGKAQPDWGAGIYLSSEQHRGFYSDIYHFWVRACFSFAEDVQRYRLLQEVQPFLHCVDESVALFWGEYHDVLKNLKKDDYFLEGQSFPASRVELDKAFSAVTLIVDCPKLRSLVARSGEDYVALFKLPDMLGTQGKDASPLST